jgi:N-acetylmuramic acid 6-phosphate etherase
MDYLLGIDGGGSKTAALLAESNGRVLGRGTAGTANYQVVGAAGSRAALDAAIESALADAGLDQQPGRALVVGLAGMDRPDDSLVFEQWAAERRPATQSAVVNDALLVLAAGTHGGWGLALICGTGSIVYGRTADGQVARAGGWGYLLGDEGSGYAIGLAVLRAVARAADGRGPQTLLAGLVLAYWSLSAPQELIRQVNRERPGNPNIAALAALVDEAAAAGDHVARTIVQESGRELALAAVTVAGRLALPNPVPCALAGGAIIQSRPLAGAFEPKPCDLAST